MEPSQGFNTSLTIPKHSKSHGLSKNVSTVIVEGQIQRGKPESLLKQTENMKLSLYLTLH